MNALLTIGGAEAELDLTVADPRLAPVGAAVRAELADLPGVIVVDDPDRPAGLGYYAGLCFKAHVVRDGRRIEIGDGGVVDWTQGLLGNRKERLVTSAVGIEGLASL
jgi:histidyl-tRNA synthetase